MNDAGTRARLFAGGRLVIASHNPGKLGEIAELMLPFGVAVVSAAALGLPEPEETESTFVANATLKALAAAKGAGLPALADDSGLVVDALGGAPGIFSARWAGPSRDFDAAMKRVLGELEGQGNRAARFVSVLALAWPDGHCEIFEGIAEGTIASAQRGQNGFGYDPIFLPTGRDLTFGEMRPSEKNAVNHRAKAFAKLAAACFGNVALRQLSKKA